MEYSPSATVGQAGYWGNKYGTSDISNQFRIWNWRAGRYSGNLGGARYYPVVNKDTGDIAVVKLNPSGSDYSIGTIKKSNGDFVSYRASRDENYYFNLPANAERVKKQALFTANKEFNAESRANKPRQNPQQLLYNNVRGNANVATPDDPSGVVGGLSGVANSVASALGTVGQSGNIASRASGGSGSAYLAVPAGIENSGQDYLSIVALKPPQPGSSSGAGGTWSRRSAGGDRPTEGSTIILPIPGGITDQNGVDWGDGKMNAIDTVKAQVALAGIKEGGEGFEKAVGSVANQLKANEASLRPALEAMIAGAVSGNSEQLLKRQSGEVMNPNLELLFNGPVLRTFTFNFKLSPRNRRESQTIISIISWFKQKMAVKGGDGALFLKSPNTWRLAYKHRGQDHRYLNKFKECAMLNCSVSYTDGGNYSTYEDGAMTSYGLGLTFREMEPIFQGDYKGSNEIGF